MSRRHLALALLPLVLIGGGLAGCTPTAPASDQSDTGTDTGTDSGSDGGTTSDDDGDDGSFAGVTIPGDGSYAIPDEIPFGGYQLVGDPGVLPDGCTWSITGSGGTVADTSNGAYVFITDIPEADTFTTAGCPDWEQFE